MENSRPQITPFWHAQGGRRPKQESSQINEQTNQDVSDKLTKLVNKRWSEKLTSDKLSETLKKHFQPENLGNLVAHVNPEIWAKMGHMAKHVDLSQC